MTGPLVLVRGHLTAVLLTGLTAVLIVALLAASLSVWDGHRAEDKREGRHRSPPPWARAARRLPAAWWYCRAWAAWWWWRARMAAHRPRTWWAWRRYVKLLPTPAEEVMPSGPAAPASVQMHGLPDGTPVSGAGGACPSPALPPAVTDVLPDAAIDAIVGYLASGWAIHAQFDTAEFARITAGA